MGVTEDLKVYQKAYRLSLEIYRLTGDFPSSEKFGLVSQMRRAAVSVGANIAEGSYRGSSQDQSRFITYAIGSTRELRYFVALSGDLGFLSERNKAELHRQCNEVIKMLHGLAKYFRSTKLPTTDY